MIEDVLLLLLIAALVALDLVSIAARAALMESSYARLITIKEGQETRVNRALELHSRLPRGKASVNLALVLTRFRISSVGDLSNFDETASTPPGISRCSPCWVALCCCLLLNGGCSRVRSTMRKKA